jgi:hypothetical protein
VLCPFFCAHHNSQLGHALGVHHVKQHMRNVGCHTLHEVLAVAHWLLEQRWRLHHLLLLHAHELLLLLCLAHEGLRLRLLLLELLQLL